MQNKRLHVLVVGSTYPRAAADHQVPWLRESVRNLVERGVLVTVLAPAFRGLADHLIDGVNVRRFRYAPAHLETLTHDEGAPNKLKTWWVKLLVVPYILAGMVATLRVAWAERIDVIQIHWPFPHGLFALLPRWLLGVHIISTCHGAELALARNSKPIRAVLAFCLRQSDGITANSSHTCREIQKLGSFDVAIIPYGSTVAPAGPVVVPSAGAPVRLLTCGRLIERKGVDVLLRALPWLLARNPGLELDITGEGDCKQAWMALAEELGVAPAVHFRGFVSNDELKALYAGASVYVHPSIVDRRGDTEGLGVVLIEALKYRLPVVASAVGGIVDVILDHETGLLVPPGNPGALADSVQWMIDHPAEARALGEGGFNHACLFFDWSRITDLLLAELCPPFRHLTLPATPRANAKASDSTTAIL